MEKNQLEMNRKGDLAALVTFCVDSEKFKSNYERNKFYRGLYGWKQRVRKGGKEYLYDHRGLLDRIPHIKVDKSVCIVPAGMVDTFVDYLEQWGDRVDYSIFKVLLQKDRFKKMKTKEYEDSGWIEVKIE